MATYECVKCGMGVNATCAKCDAPLVDDVLKLDLRSALAARDAVGGTAPRRVATALRRARRRLRSATP